MARPITVLNVAEKNSVSKEVTRLLCQGRPQELPSWWAEWRPLNFTAQPSPPRALYRLFAASP